MLSRIYKLGRPQVPEWVVPYVELSFAGVSAVGACAVCGHSCPVGCCVCEHWLVRNHGDACYGLTCDEGHSVSRCVRAVQEWHWDVRLDWNNGRRAAFESGEGFEEMEWHGSYETEGRATEVSEELERDGAYPADLVVMYECENVRCRVEGRFLVHRG